MDKYNPAQIEPKWQKIWEKHKLYQAVDFDKKRPKKYLLVEFPYPSGSRLHIGHSFCYLILDALARKKRMEGFNVLYPMGWDAFGLPTENYAVKTGIPPAVATKKNIDFFRSQFKRLGFAYNWEREVNTTDSDYYRWTQWIFIQLFKHGLAYKAKVPVGWCPACKIILANEEIVSGKCERCGAETERRMQKQWLLRITAYADRLAADLDEVDYPDYVKAAQRNWIGRSEGAEIEFLLETTLRVGESRITVFTTRVDTIFGATAVVIAPEHPVVASLLKFTQHETRNMKHVTSNMQRELGNYVQAARQKSELERTELIKEKTGVFTGLYCQNPINGKKIPVWVGDYVIGWYGGGAVMVVPAHDQRDFEFTKKYNLPVKVVIRPISEPSNSSSPSQVFEEDGLLVNSGQFTGLTSAQARRKITTWLEERKLGKKRVSYHLRDWIFSRQHYWGEPIPMIFCPACSKKGIIYPDLLDFPDHPDLAGWLPLPEDQLPLKLPKVEKYQPTTTGESPLANIKDWVKTTCPHCQGPARRETDTMPNWAGSSWYYLAYLIAGKLRNSKFQNIFTANKNILAYWLPVDLYLGGAEHTTLHLLYSRFWHKFLFDIGVVPGKEPYAARRQHGVILGEDGFRMSKSRGNVINPEDVIAEYGADTLRVYLMFMGPYTETIVWNTKGVEGAYRFLARVWKLVLSSLDFPDFPDHPDFSPLVSRLHCLIKKVGEDIEVLKYNTAIANMMEFVNEWQKCRDAISCVSTDSAASCVLSKSDLQKFLLILAPFAPHMTEELWFRISLPSSVHLQPWPSYDPKLIKKEKVVVIIQVNGKLRDRLEVTPDEAKDKKKMVELAFSSPKIQKYFPNPPKFPKSIFVPGKLVNFVVS